MKKSQRNARRESIWSTRPEHQDLQESRSGRLWAGWLPEQEGVETHRLK